MGLGNAFKFVLCSALERSGTAPGNTLHAGDHLRNDVEPAAALGLQPVLVDHHGRFAGEELPCPCVDGLEGLRALIL